MNISSTVKYLLSPVWSLHYMAWINQMPLNQLHSQAVSGLVQSLVRATTSASSLGGMLVLFPPPVLLPPPTEDGQFVKDDAVDPSGHVTQPVLGAVLPSSHVGAGQSLRSVTVVPSAHMHACPDPTESHDGRPHRLGSETMVPDDVQLHDWPDVASSHNGTVGGTEQSLGFWTVSPFVHTHSSFNEEVSAEHCGGVALAQ
jgi:hypothetical protein